MSGFGPHTNPWKRRARACPLTRRVGTDAGFGHVQARGDAGVASGRRGGDDCEVTYASMRRHLKLTLCQAGQASPAMRHLLARDASQETSKYGSRKRSFRRVEQNNLVKVIDVRGVPPNLPMLQQDRMVPVTPPSTLHVDRLLVGGFTQSYNKGCAYASSTTASPPCSARSMPARRDPCLSAKALNKEPSTPPFPGQRRMRGRVAC